MSGPVLGKGTNDTIHAASPATEWWVVFLKPNAVERDFVILGDMNFEDAG